MVVQIDIDGTINWAPVFFAWMTRVFQREGHRVLIVTTLEDVPGERELTEEELRGWEITYDKLILSPPLGDLDSRRFPPGLHPSHKLYVYKLFVAQDHGTDILFDDCGITADLFRKHLPQVKVFRPLR